MKRFRIYGAVILAMIFWSLTFIWFKIANETYRPVTVVFFRLLFAVIVLTLYLLFTRKFVRIRKEDRWLFIILSVLCGLKIYAVKSARRADKQHLTQ